MGFEVTSPCCTDEESVSKELRECEKVLDALKTAFDSEQSLEVRLECSHSDLPLIETNLLRIYNAATRFNPLADISVKPVQADGLCIPSVIKTSSYGPNIWDYVALGGTFDRLHNGHKMLLTTAVLHCSAKLRVGVATDELLAKKELGNLIEPLDQRISAVLGFLHRICPPDLILDVLPIDEFTGGTASMRELQAIVATAETSKGVERINELRSQNGLPQLNVILVAYIQNSEGLSSDVKLSSSKLRELHAKKKS
jgi:pantetheine-phosphate adenylyltransferase